MKKLIPKIVRKQVKLLMHSGYQYLCPFCNYSSKDLEPIGRYIPVLNEKQVIGAGRRNCRCYKCGSIDRERLVYLYLKEVDYFFKKTKSKKVLHISPERQLSKIFLKHEFEEYSCGDLFTEGYKYPVHVQNIDILQIPYEDNFFDLVICNHVLEHVENDLLAMRELRRVLKNGAQAILQVPISDNSEVTIEDFSIIDPLQRELTFGQYDHVRIYGQDYVLKLEESGLQVNRINISSQFSKYGLNEDEDLFICRK